MKIGKEKKNKQSPTEEMTFEGDDKHELCQLLPLKSPTALETRRSCAVTGHVDEVRVTRGAVNQP